jgi:hypothetical protein
MGLPQTITMRDFRRTQRFSGNVRVEGGSRTRRGVRRQNRPASCKSPTEPAGSDAARGLTAGGSAPTSAARAADHKTDAGPAEKKAKKARGTPDKKKQSKPKHAKGGGGDGPIESLWNERATLDGGVPLPEDGIGFVDAVNANIDLRRLTEILLRGRDEKSSKSLLELLLEMRYGKDARHAEETPQAVLDIPGLSED